MCKDNDKNKDKGGRRILVKMKDGRATIFISLLSKQCIHIYMHLNGGAWGV